jgi:hypothetical protein
MKPRKPGVASAAGELDDKQIVAKGFKGRGYVPTPRSQLVNLSYNQLELRRRKIISRIEGLKDSIKALRCDPEMLQVAYEKNLSLQSRDLEEPLPPPFVPDLDNVSEYQPIVNPKTMITENVLVYNEYARERLRAIFDVFDHRQVGYWNLYDFATYCIQSLRQDEFKHELFSQTTYETIILKRYASSQIKVGLDYEGFVRFHWDCRLVRTLHDDLGILKLDLRNIMDREKERIYNSINLISKTLILPVKLPETTRKLLEKEARKEVRRQEREGERIRKPKIPAFLDLPDGAVLPQHVRLFVYDLYQIVISEERGHEIIKQYGWTEDVPYVLIDNLVDQIVENTKTVTLTSIIKSIEVEKQKQLQEKMKELNDIKKAKNKRKLMSELNDKNGSSIKKNNYDIKILKRKKNSGGYIEIIPFVKECLKHDMQYFFNKTALRVKLNCLLLKGRLQTVSQMYEKRRTTDPLPMKKKKKKKLAALQVDKVVDDRLKSGVVLQSEIVIGDIDRRMFSNSLGAENIVTVQVDWLKLEATALTELLDSIEAPDKVETFITVDFAVHDFIPTDRLDTLEMGFRGILNKYIKDIFEAIPQYHSFTIEFVEGEGSPVYRLCIFFAGKAMHIRKAFGMYMPIANLLRSLSARFDISPGEKNIFAQNRSKLAILNDIFKARGSMSFTIPRKHVMEFLTCLKQAIDENPTVLPFKYTKEFATWFHDFIEWMNMHESEITLPTLLHYINECTWLQDLIGRKQIAKLGNILENPGGFVKYIEKLWQEMFYMNFEETQGHVRRGLHHFKQNEYTKLDYDLVCLHGLFVECIKGIVKIQFQCSERSLKFTMNNFQTQLFSKMILHNPGGK